MFAFSGGQKSFAFIRFISECRSQEMHFRIYTFFRSLANIWAWCLQRVYCTIARQRYVLNLCAATNATMATTSTMSYISPVAYRFHSFSLALSLSFVGFIFPIWLRFRAEPCSNVQVIVVVAWINITGCRKPVRLHNTRSCSCVDFLYEFNLLLLLYFNTSKTVAARRTPHRK